MISIDNSQLQTYITCPRRYYYKYVKELRKVRNEEQEIDLNFGKCFHKSLEILYKENDLEKAKSVFRNEFNLIETEKAKTPANGEKLVEAYRNYWSSPVNELSDTNLETIEVEEVQRFNISDEVEWIVKRDRVAKNSAGIWSVETKTSNKMAYNYFKKFDLSMQITGQCEGIRRKYGQCSGAIINLAVVGYRERAYKGEPAGFHCQFVRDITNRNGEQYDFWVAQVLGWAKRLTIDLQTSKDGLHHSAFLQNTDACSGYKGCPYTELCKSCNDQSVEEVCYEKHDSLEYLKEDENDKD